MDNYHKYLIYKNKYIKLKNKLFNYNKINDIDDTRLEYLKNKFYIEFKLAHELYLFYKKIKNNSNNDIDNIYKLYNDNIKLLSKGIISNYSLTNINKKELSKNLINIDKNNINQIIEKYYNMSNSLSYYYYNILIKNIDKPNKLLKYIFTFNDDIYAFVNYGELDNKTKIMEIDYITEIPSKLLSSNKIVNMSRELEKYIIDLLKPDYILSKDNKFEYIIKNTNYINLKIINEKFLDNNVLLGQDIINSKNIKLKEKINKDKQYIFELNYEYQLVKFNKQNLEILFDDNIISKINPTKRYKIDVYTLKEKYYIINGNMYNSSTLGFYNE
jgi:hypothetical protein